MISVEIDTLQSIGEVSDTCQKSSKDLLRQALKSASPYVLSENEKNVRIKALSTNQNTLLISGNDLPKTEQGIKSLFSAFPPLYIRKHRVQKDAWLLTFPDNNLSDALYFIKKNLQQQVSYVTTEIDVGIQKKSYYNVPQEKNSSEQHIPTRPRTATTQLTKTSSSRRTRISYVSF